MSASKKIVIIALLLFAISSLPACDKDESQPLDDDLLRSCAMLISCVPAERRLPIAMACEDIFNANNRASDRSTDTRAAQGRVQCMRAATDCDSLLPCIVPDEEQASLCGDIGDACFGDIAVSCDDDTDEALWILDCGAAGLTCFDTGFDAECGVESCDPDSHEPSCDGDLLVECDRNDHVVTAKDCRWDLGVVYTEGEFSSAFGGTCGEDDSGRLDCVGDGDVCDQVSFETHCDGDVVESCKYGRIARFDCRDSSPYFTCFDSDDEVGCWTDEFFGCNPAHTSCEDGVLKFCWWATTQWIDCRRYGFSGCDVVEDEEYGFIAGFCVP